MKKILDLLPSFPSDLDRDVLIESLLEDPNIRAFAVANDLKHSSMISGLNTFLSYREQHTACSKCPGLLSCTSPHPGMEPILTLESAIPAIKYQSCRHAQSVPKKRKIDALYVPQRVFEAELSDMDLISESRRVVHRAIVNLFQSFDNNKPVKGMYLVGPYQTGKTYILAAIANEFAKRDLDIVFGYYPDMVREFKSSIGDGSLEEKVRRLKSADVLFLDDIGGESTSPFIRDEVLGPILQHRLMDQKLTFFSSNLPLASYKTSMLSTESNLEKSKAGRIYERIAAMATEYEIKEKPIRSA